MGILGKLFGRSGTPASFWKWFAASASRYEGPLDQGHIEELSTQLRRVHPDLAFQIGKSRQGGWELEVSADGIRAMIPVVQELVAAAPAIPGWTVQSFRQPQTGISVEMNGRSYNAQEVYYQLARGTGAGVDLEIFIAGFDAAPEAVGQIGFILLDSTIGELAVMTRVAGIDFHDLARRGDTARPLAELPGELTRSG